MQRIKLGSLFDGSGGFPLAGTLCGIEPVWASEVEPYPIAVTRSRFPKMKHIGDISNVSGSEIEPVDIITFGSPCQDLSVAGKRAGLKHEAYGDEETTRSGLFMEAVRIIKEMRNATNGEYPTFALWENVPGAFSSNRGEDFRIVLEELIKIVEPTAVMPAVPKNGWPYADSYCGNGWSLAYRVFDAQYWGVPQRRRRIHLVADFRGERARKVLFERAGVRGYFAESGAQREAAAADASRCFGADDREGAEVISAGFDAYNQILTGDKSMTVTCSASDTHHVPCAVISQMSSKDGCDVNTAYGFPLGFRPENVRVYEENSTTLCNGTRPGFTAGVICKTYDARGNGDGETVSTLTGDHENRITDYTSVICLQGNGIDRADTEGCNGKGWREDASCTLNTIDRPAVAYRKGGFADYVEGERGTPKASGGDLGGGSESFIVEKKPRYIVRRLTPTECARLQGFPDQWGHPNHKDAFTDEEYSFWSDVRNTHAAINGKAVKEYTRQQMITWYNKLHTDSAEYKMWGNGIALPPALYCMQGIKEVLNEKKDD